MESKRLSKHQSLVVQLLCGGAFAGLLGGALIFLYSFGAFAQATPPTAPGAALAAATTDAFLCAGPPVIVGTACADIVRRARGGVDACEAALSKLNDSLSAVQRMCGTKSTASTSSLSTCETRINTCLSDSSVDPDLEDPEEVSSDPCSTLNKSCPEANGGSHKDYTDSKKSAQESMDSAQRKVDELAAQQQKDQASTAQQIQKITNDLQSSGLALKNLQANIASDLIAKSNEAGVNQAGAIVAARTKLDGINAKIIELNDQANQLASAVESLKSQRVTGCKAYAESMYAKDLEKLQAKFDKQDSVIRNLGSATQMMAYTQNQAKKRLAAKNESYSGHYNTCLSGTEGNGASAGSVSQDKIKDAQMASDNAAKKRDQQMGQLKLDQANATTDMNTIIEQINKKLALDKKVDADKLQAAVDEYNLKSTQGQAEILRLQQTQQKADQLAQQQQMTAQQSLMRAQTDFGTAATQLSCSDKVGKGMSDAAAKTKMDNWGKASGAISGLKSSCQTLSSTACADTSFDKSSCPGSATGNSRSRPAAGSGTSR